MNSFRVVLSLAIVFIIAVMANTAKGYMFFYRHIDTLLVICGVVFLLFVLTAFAFRKFKSRTSYHLLSNADHVPGKHWLTQIGRT